MWQRSEDGKTWETIDKDMARNLIEGYYNHVDEIMKDMEADPRILTRTPFAVYRFFGDLAKWKQCKELHEELGFPF